MVCEISNIFQEFYSGKTTPLSLHDLLVLIWKNASHLAGYKQQDAHEFFIATLNLLHTHFRDSSSSRTQQDPCSCIIDEIFTGELLSDLVCTTCRHVSPTFEPFKDLSLDLSFDSCGQPKTLINCLERFTRLEYLGPNAKLTCSKCNAEREFTKELSIQTLPIIASFHLKRFEQTGLVMKNLKVKKSLKLSKKISEWQEENFNIHFVPRRARLDAILGKVNEGKWSAHKSTVSKIFALRRRQSWGKINRCRSLYKLYPSFKELLDQMRRSQSHSVFPWSSPPKWRLSSFLSQENYSIYRLLNCNNNNNHDIYCKRHSFSRVIKLM